jgi:probable F420-dependent oxidoreductase
LAVASFLLASQCVSVNCRAPYDGFRFGVLIGGVESRGTSTVTSREEFKNRVRRLEGQGFDVLCMPDHVGSVAPFPALVAAAHATSTIRLGTCVLNAAFYRPELLARDAAEVNLHSDGRLELGLGAGYVQEEFDAVGLPFVRGGARIHHLGQVIACVRKHLPDVPVMIAGNGDRLLTMAARNADIVGLTGEPGKPGTTDPLADRIKVIRTAVASRVSEPELNLLLSGMPTDGSGRADLRLARRHLPHLSDEELSDLPGVLHGGPNDIADTLRDYRDRYCLSHFTVMEFHAEHFAQVIAQLR